MYSNTDRLRHRIASAMKEPPHQRTSILRRIVSQSILLTCIAVLSFSALSFVIVQNLLEQRVLQQLTSMVDAREYAFENTMQQQRERTFFLAQDEALRSIVQARRGGDLPRLLERFHAEEPALEGLTVMAGSYRAVAGTQSPSLPQVPSATVTVPSIDRKAGWTGMDVYTPVRLDGGRRLGTLAAHFSASETLRILTDLSTLGPSAQLWLGEERGGQTVVLYQSSPAPLKTYAVWDQDKDDQASADLPLRLATRHQEGATSGLDVTGHPVLAAYGFLSSLGWGMVVQVGVADAYAGLLRLQIFLFGIGVLLLALAGVLSVILARRLTSPLLSLAASLLALRPGHWSFRRSVQTGDEVEVLDHVAAELTSRLKMVYDNLEKEVADRTEDLRKQYLLDRTILERMEYGVFVLDVHGMVTTVNPAACRLLGATQQALLGQAALDVLPLVARDGNVSALQHPVMRAIKERKTYHSSHALRPSVLRADGSVMPAIVVATPIVQGKRLVGVIVTLQDTTEERQVDEMKSEFITLASHQLRTPLSSLRWYLELFSDEAKNLPHAQREYLTEMDNAAKRLADLLDDLLHVARLEEGNFTPDLRPLDLRKLLLDLRKQWEDFATQHGKRCALHLPENPVKVASDPVLLHLVLQNLYTNALKYSAPGSEVHVALKRAHSHVEISVSDTGMGIPNEERKHLFEKFFRAKNAKRVDADGTGLGLYLSRTIIRTLRGTISFHSVTGKGTTFTVRLPIGLRRKLSTT